MFFVNNPLKIIRSLYFTSRLYFVLGGFFLLFVLSYFFGTLLPFAKAAFFITVAVTLGEGVVLYLRQGIAAGRITPDKLSNGDYNTIRAWVENSYGFAATIRVIDEIPHQFQVRNTSFDTLVRSGEKETLAYELRPVKRGEYAFGALHVYVTSPIGLVLRRFSFGEGKTVPVYPSYLQMHQYQLLAIHNRLADMGIKKIRKIGHNFEFEQIKEYVQGDDFRTINWKATARKAQLMVNQFQDEKSQQVYCIIDKGRVMRSPFDGLSLLDYAINASLVLSNVAIRKSDKAGVLTVSESSVQMVSADRKPTQMHRILEMLYAQKTRYLEPNYERLFSLVRHKITQRSLLILFTNFESVSAMRRNLSYFRSLATQHALVVVFFENTETQELLKKTAHSSEDIYIQTIAEKFAYEKQQIVAELKAYGIYAVLTSPKELTVNTINKYLELKARGII